MKNTRRAFVVLSILCGWGMGCVDTGSQERDPGAEMNLGPDDQIAVMLPDPSDPWVLVGDTPIADAPVVDPPVDSDPPNNNDTVPVDPGADEFDPIEICLQDCNYQGDRADEVDCDYDGLSNADELTLGTDPCSSDTDGDGLPDLAELQGGTDPNSSDTDGDGLSDGDEHRFGFDPNNPSTLNDNVLDSDRWVVTACDEPMSEPVDFYVNAQADWQIALPPTYNNHRDLILATASPVNGLAAAVHDDPGSEIAGFILSMQPTPGQSSPVDVLIDAAPAFASIGDIVQDATGGAFDTYDFDRAAIGRYLIEVGQPTSARQFRDDLLFALAPFQAIDVTGLPNAAGALHGSFRVFLSATYRRDMASSDRVVLSLAVAPARRFEEREKVRFRMDDLTNTSNVSRADDGVEQGCNVYRGWASEATADFYWMLDQSGSMDNDYVNVQRVANLFYSNLENTALDFRLAVGHMDIAYGGKPRAQTGWFTDLGTLIDEIDYVRNAPLDSGREFGLQCAQDGISWMRSNQAPMLMQIRPNAPLVTIFMSDEEAQTIQNDPLSTPNGRQKLDAFKTYFGLNTIAYAIVGNGAGTFSSAGQAYREVALATGGGYASLDANNIGETIDDIIFAATGAASNYVLRSTPISSTLRVFKSGEWVPRSRENGFDYFAQSNAIAFFGSYRPAPVHVDLGQHGEDIAVHYRAFFDKTK